MPDDKMDSQSHALASQLLRKIENADRPRGVVLKALDYCRNQLENRTTVETAVAVSGCSTNGFLWNSDLELYYDIVKDGAEVAFISKGWNDPGFRVGELIVVPDDTWDDMDDRLARSQRFCATNGIAMSSLRTDDSGHEVTFEYVICSAGFDGRTFAQALATLIACTTKFKGS